MIHIVRDPRANISSQRARWPELTVTDCAIWWRDAVRIGRATANEDPEHCIELRYEDLVLDPSPTLQYLCKALGLTFSEAMMSFDYQTTSFQPDAKPENVRHQGIDASRLERWRQYLDDDEVQIIERYCGAEMAWWNYERTQLPSSPNIALAWRLTRERGGHQYKKSGRQVKGMLRKVEWKRRSSS